MFFKKKQLFTLGLTGGLVGGIIVVLVFVAFLQCRDFFYPKPQHMPPVVTQSVEELLERLQLVLGERAPAVADALQVGLTNAQISALETKGGFKLSDDLRTFYRWRDGSANSSGIDLLAGHRWVPLGEAVQVREQVTRANALAPAWERTVFSVFAGHRESWLLVLDDGAGNGYFYDAERADTEGAFFYYFDEGGYYFWFPSVRNFLAGLIECYESGAIKIAQDGKSLNEDFVQTAAIWQKFGISREEQ